MSKKEDKLKALELTLGKLEKILWKGGCDEVRR